VIFSPDVLSKRGHMKFLRLNSTDPYLNLAIEEYFFDNFTEDIFMLWQNEPTVVIGKNQNVYAEINREYLKKNNIKVARRITGGGAVYHDLGNINYSFIGNIDQPKIDFEYFSKPIIEALSSLGLSVSLSGRNDIMAGDKKISGNAQCNRGGRVLHHGTLLFNSDLSVLSEVLSVDPEKIKAKALSSTRQRVANISELLKQEISISQFINGISDSVVNKYSPEIIEAPENEEIERLRKRNSSLSWLYPEKSFLSDYEIILKKRYPFGIVSLSLKMQGEMVKAAKLFGDFFEIRDISELENELCGKTLETIKNYVSMLKIENYIFGMTSSDLIDLLTEI